ncbi:MAG: ABC transporter ATP-binding protein [Verrucomicrobiae bacterium]|nr:ABC transporter ATP-binding protein [Verrucomicrobiae bacterium]
MTGLRRVILLLWPHRWKVAGAIACANVTSLAVLALPLIAKDILARAIHRQESLESLGAFAALLITFALLTGAGYISMRLMFLVAISVAASLRSRYVDHLLNLPIQTHRRLSAGDLVDRILVGTGEVQWSIRNTVGPAIGLAILAAGAIAMTFVMSWKLACLTFAAFPFGWLLYTNLQARIRHTEKARLDAGSRLTAYIHEILTAIEVIKAFDARPHETRRFNARQDDLIARQRDALSAVALLDPAMVGSAAIAIASVLLYGSHLIAAGEMRPETLIAFLIYLLILVPQVRLVALHAARWQQFLRALDRLDDIQALEPERDAPGAVALSHPVRGAIQFRDVTYSYPGRDAALRGLVLNVGPQEHVGIVGESGAGKSTLFNLLLRFDDPQEGSILIDGTDTTRATRQSVRAAIAFVPQDIVLFDDSVLQNVRYGRPDAGDDDVRRACRAAGAHDFILGLPQQYETPLGSRGLNLSGGQRQRIAIARALLRDAPILLMDEATSALDSQSEERLRSAMETAMRGRTTLIIAHRLATVVRLPRIILMHQGSVVDDGSHAELLSRCPRYRDLVATQLIPSAAESRLAAAAR